MIKAIMKLCISLLFLGFVILLSLGVTISNVVDWLSSIGANEDENISINQNPVEFDQENSALTSWGKERINAYPFINYLRQRGKSQESIIVAVLDTGIDPNHPSLRGRVLQGWNALDRNYNTFDYDGHGTLVAGVIADITYGMNVYLLPVKVLGDRSFCGTTSDGIRWAIDNGAQVINMSFGVSCSRETHCRNLNDAITWATAAGATVVTSAGNNAENADHRSTAFSFGAFTVAATGINDRPASFTNWGSLVNISAPGTNIMSTYLDGLYTIASGTSMAAPHVSAAVALYKLLNPDISPAAVKRNFESYVDIPADWDIDRYGAGIMNLERAIPNR